jgi:hypothetical protein
MILDSPAAREITVDDREMLLPVDVPPPVSSSVVPPQAVRNKSIAKEISSNNVRDNFVLIDFIMLLSFLLGTDDILFLYGNNFTINIIELPIFLCLVKSVFLSGLLRVNPQKVAGRGML